MEENGVMGGEPGGPAADRPREWLALPGGRIRPVVSVPGPGGIAELLAYAAWLARLPVRQASPGFGPDLRKRGMRSRAPHTGGRQVALAIGPWLAGGAAAEAHGDQRRRGYGRHAAADRYFPGGRRLSERCRRDRHHRHRR